MGKYKRIILLALFFSFIGVGFSNGLLFKKNKLVEDVIEYDEIVRKVKKSQRKPASIHSAKRAKTRPSVVTDTFQPDLPKNLADVVDENINEADSSASLANPSEVQDSSSEKVRALNLPLMFLKALFLIARWQVLIQSTHLSLVQLSVVTQALLMVLPIQILVARQPMLLLFIESNPSPLKMVLLLLRVKISTLFEKSLSIHRVQLLSQKKFRVLHHK